MFRQCEQIDTSNQMERCLSASDVFIGLECVCAILLFSVYVVACIILVATL